MLVRERVARYRDRVRRELRATLEEDHHPREIAGSFAIGIFVTAMPSGGLGIGLLIVLCYYWAWMSKVASFAAIAVLNPLIKPLVYVASFHVGVLLLGADPLFLTTNPTLEYMLTLVQFLLVGNLLIALGLAATSYVVILYLVKRYRHRRDLPTSSTLSTTASMAFWRNK